MITIGILLLALNVLTFILNVVNGSAFAFVSLIGIGFSIYIIVTAHRTNQRRRDFKARWDKFYE